jgi:hypothetical protein
MKSYGRTNEYDDELKIDQSFSFEGILTNDSNEEEMCFGNNPQGWNFVSGRSKSSKG